MSDHEKERSNKEEENKEPVQKSHNMKFRKKHDHGKDSSYKEKKKKTVQKTDFGLDPSLLQRAPSHITVKAMCSPKHECSKTIVILEGDETDSISINPEQCEKDVIPQSLQSLHNVDVTESDVRQEKPGPGKTDACFDCVTPVQVKSFDDIQRGDHILFVRPLYDHHAVVVAVHPVEDQCKHKVRLDLIHQTNSATGALRDSFRPGRRIAKLKRKTWTVDLKSTKTMICKYTGTIKPFSPNEIIERASEAIKNEKVQFKYEMLDNNCEHFASWCVTGRQLSIQTRKVRMVVHLFWRKGFRGISDELVRNESEYKNGILCEACYQRNSKILSVEWKFITNQSDVFKGDIIMYSYYRLWHCAVVLDVLKQKDRYVKCQIAHYAFCGPFAHRTIKAEPLNIFFDDSVKVFIYPETFELYEPEEVVERAKTRIGEQMFAFFSNDSSNFSRWCKLKLRPKQD